MPLLPPTILYWHLSSKSPTSPLRQMMNVFPLVGLSAVVWPVIAASLTLQNSGLPSQPSSDLPSKIGSKPSSSAARAQAASSSGSASANKERTGTLMGEAPGGTRRTAPARWVVSSQSAIQSGATAAARLLIPGSDYSQPLRRLHASRTSGHVRADAFCRRLLPGLA